MTPGAVDPAVVRRHLAAMQDALQRLARHAGRSSGELRADPDLRWVVERGLQLAAQNTLDIASHLVAARGLDAPDYASAILRLAEIGVVTPELAERLRPLAGFRNVLVHGYLHVDLDVVQRVLVEKLPELEEFARSVEGYLERTAG